MDTPDDAALWDLVAEDDEEVFTACAALMRRHHPDYEGIPSILEETWRPREARDLTVLVALRILRDDRGLPRLRRMLSNYLADGDILRVKRTIRAVEWINTPAAIKVLEEFYAGQHRAAPGKLRAMRV